MSLLYVSYGVVWLIVSACQWRDLLRIQVTTCSMFAQLTRQLRDWNKKTNDNIVNRKYTIFWSKSILADNWAFVVQKEF